MAVRDLAVAPLRTDSFVTSDGNERCPALIVDFGTLALSAAEWRDELRLIVRRGMSGGWIAEIRVTGAYTNEQAECMAEIARVTGRPLRLAGGPDIRPTLRAGETLAVESVAGAEELVLRLRRVDRHGLRLKRALDLLLTVPVLILVAPALAVVALLVRLGSAGPALYAWRVLGENGRPFTGYKFRTMHKSADDQKYELLAQNEMVGPVFKMKQDPRVTKLGRFLRKYSIDELPQLWSVLRGDMSLVGPRPAFRSEYEQYELWQMRRLSAKPGLTCIWQVEGRNQINHFAQWAALDLEYIDRWSVSLDLRVLAKTIGTVLTGTGL